MAVVEKKPEVKTSSAFDRLAIASLAGVVYLLGSLAVAFKAVPALCQLLGLSTVPLLPSALSLAAVVTLAVVGYRLMGGTHSRLGLRAGIFLGFVFLAVWALFTRWVGGIVEGSAYNGWLKDTSFGVGVGITVALSLVVGYWLVRLFCSAGFEKRIVAFEEAGWFTFKTYKQGQGVRVRRGTILGVLLMAGSGIWVMMNNRLLERGSANWELNVPFTGQVAVNDLGDALRATKDGRPLLDAEKAKDFRVVSVGVAGMKKPLENALVEQQNRLALVEQKLAETSDKDAEKPLKEEKERLIQEKARLEAWVTQLKTVEENTSNFKEGATVERKTLLEVVKPLAEQKRKDLDRLIERLQTSAKTLDEDIKKAQGNPALRSELTAERTLLAGWLEKLRAFRPVLAEEADGNLSGRVFLLQEELKRFLKIEEDQAAERRKADLQAQTRRSLKDELQWIADWVNKEPLPLAAYLFDRHMVRDLDADLDPLRYRVIRSDIPADYTVTLKSPVPEDKKSAIVAAVKSTTRLDTKLAEELVTKAQSEPVVVRERIDEKTANEIRTKLEEAGAAVTVEEYARDFSRLTTESHRFKRNEIVPKSTFQAALDELKPVGKNREEQEAKRLSDESLTKLAPEAKPTKGTTTYASIMLLPSVRFTVPLLLMALAIWVAWRIVNLPSFADFLIATEAEMNKVSWTTRQRLVQDTIVVLMTMVLMAFFLFLVDVAWGKLLSSKPIEVLKIAKPTAKNDQQKQQRW